MVSAMTWTTEKPTVPGWYWWRNKTRMDIFQVRQIDIDIWDDVPHAPAEWAGPLEPPKE